MDKSRNTAIGKRQFIFVFLTVFAFAGAAIYLNLSSVSVVSDKTEKLSNQYVPELKNIFDSLTLIRKTILNLHQYYATLDRSYYLYNSEIIEDFIMEIDELYRFQTYKAQSSMIMRMKSKLDDFIVYANLFDQEMQSPSTDWDILREHLKNASNSATILIGLLNRYALNVRHEVSQVSDSSLKQIKRHGYIQMGFTIAIFLIATLVIYILYGRLKDRAELYQWSYTDSTTHLPNKRRFQEDLQYHYENGEDLNFTLLLIGLDQFKLVSGTFGHFIGDELLQTYTEWLKKQIFNESFPISIYQYTSTTWLLYIPTNVELGRLYVLTEKLLTIGNTTLKLSEREIISSCSIGICRSPEHAKNIDELLRNADIALRDAKSSGGNCARLFNEDMFRRAEEWLEIDNALHNAIERQELELFYQPKICTKSGKVVSAEALIRWRRNNELVSPGVFIPVAETAGHIAKIGQWVLHEACRQWSEWKQSYDCDLPISINISAFQFEQAEFPDNVRTALKIYHMPAHCLELEITEEVASKDMKKVISIMKELKDIGVTLAIDDFGTGYSSLSKVKDLPVDVIKIDRSFINELENDQKNQSVVKLIYQLAREYQYEIVVEGVETAAQHNMLLDWGEVLMQGFLFSRPLPAQDYVALIQQNVVFSYRSELATVING